MLRAVSCGGNERSSQAAQTPLQTCQAHQLYESLHQGAMPGRHLWSSFTKISSSCRLGLVTICLSTHMGRCRMTYPARSYGGCSAGCPRYLLLVVSSPPATRRLHGSRDGGVEGTGSLAPLATRNRAMQRSGGSRPGQCVLLAPSGRRRRLARGPSRRQALGPAGRTRLAGSGREAPAGRVLAKAYKFEFRE